MNKPSRQTHGRRGFTLIETMISTMLVAIMLVTALGALGNLTRHRTEMNLETLAKMHAEELLDEILEKPYVDPDGESVPNYFFFIRLGDKLGPEGSEANGGRLLFDDVDDYHQWKSSPLKRRDGSVILHQIPWERTVTVQYVSPDAQHTASFFDWGIKKITVTVSKDGTTLAESVAFRTRGWERLP